MNKNTRSLGERKTNPHRRGSRFFYAFLMVPQPFCRLLDYGCFDGSFLKEFKPISGTLYGVDRNLFKILEARKKFEYITFSPISDENLEYDSGFFDVITCLEVLEHVPSERALIHELARVIRKDGTLIISVPQKGMLSFLDPGNFKFRFPWLIKAYYYWIRKDRDTYERRFLIAENGMVGDISLSKNMEHKHYSLPELKEILRPHFNITDCRYYGFFTPVIDLMKGFCCLVLGLEIFRALFDRLDDYDKSFSYGQFSYNIIIKCKKV